MRKVSASNILLIATSLAPGGPQVPDNSHDYGDDYDDDGDDNETCFNLSISLAQSPTIFSIDCYLSTRNEICKQTTVENSGEQLRLSTWEKAWSFRGRSEYVQWQWWWLQIISFPYHKKANHLLFWVLLQYFWPAAFIKIITMVIISCLTSLGYTWFIVCAVGLCFMIIGKWLFTTVTILLIIVTLLLFVMIFLNNWKTDTFWC